MRGNLITKEHEVIKGPSETPFTKEADELNKKHYEKKYIEKFGKTPTAGHYTPNKNTSGSTTKYNRISTSAVARTH